MAAAELMVMFIYFLMIYRRRQRRVIGEEYGGWQRCKDNCKPFTTNQQEEDLHEIVAALIADRITCSTMQHRVLWIRNSSQSFINVTASWDGLEWKRNLTLSFGSHFIAPLKRFQLNRSM